MRAGFGEVDITPALGLRTAGMPGARPAAAVRWPLRCRAAVFDDGERRAAIVVLDLLAITAETAADLRAATAAATGLDARHVFISCTHTHSAPHAAFFFDDVADPAYLSLLRDRVPEAVAAAVSDLDVAILRSGRCLTRGLTFNRRPVYVGDEVGTQGPLWVDDFLRLEGPADEELQVVAAVRRDGSLAGGLVHFACHPTAMGHEAVYSADFAGALAEQLARRHGGTFLFVQGASAQLWWADVSTPRDDPRPAVERTQQLADALADATARALDAARAVDAGRVGISSRTLEIAQRRPTREQVELAAWFLCQEEDAVDLREFSRRIYGHPFTFYVNHWTIERWFCRDMIGMWEWQRRGSAGAPADRVEIQVMSIGDVAVVGYPAEMFTEFGLETKARSPFRTTLPCGLANGWVGYVPTRLAFEHGGYEPRFGYQSRLAPDAGELMTATAIEQLHALAGSS